MQPNSKIAIVSSSLSVGGAERFASTLSFILDDLGYEVHHLIILEGVAYEYKGNLIEPLGEIGKEGRKFYVYDKNGNFISEEQNMNKYAIKNNMNCGKICEVLNKTRNSYKKYKFYNEYKGKFYDNIK